MNDVISSYLNSAQSQSVSSLYLCASLQLSVLIYIILYFNSIKFQMRLFWLTLCSFSVVEQWNKHETVTETRPIMT